MNDSKCILVCDDDEGIIDVTNIVLTEKGYDVKTVSNCKNIFQKIKQFRPCVILLDLWMPDMTGDEITRILKDDYETKDIPVIIVSASKDTEKVARLAGADDFICKPFDIDELEQKVEEYVSASQ